MANSNTTAPAPFDFLAGGGEMGALMRAHDWQATSLGTPDTWPAILKTSLRLLLTSNHPMFIWWGPELLQFYNDACRKTMGPERHPGALGQGGRECWDEVWHLIGPEIDFVMSGRGATWHEDTLVPITRHGKHEEVWWTYGYSPIEDETGVRGVLVVCQDVTEAHLLRESIEQSYAALVNAIEHGFCVIESIFDDEGTPVDYRFLETNSAFENETGLRNVQGKTAKELVPDLEGHWVATYGRVALTGEPIRFFEEAPSMGRWFEVYAAPIGRLEKRRVALLFKDVSEQKRIEKELQKNADRHAFALALADRLRDVESPEGLVARACEMLGQKFGASRVVYGEVDRAGKTVFTRRDWVAEGMPSMSGATTVMSDFGSETVAMLRAGQIVVNNDIALDRRSANYVEAYRSIKVCSEVLVPLVKAGKLMLVLAFHKNVPYQWTPEEIEFMQEMAERTWVAVEAANAQAQLRHERDHSRYIFDSMTEGFALLDSAWNVMEANAEATRITRRTESQIVGRNHWTIWPELRGTELEALYQRVKETKTAEVMEFPYRFPDASEIWIEVRVYPSLAGGLAVFFRDITDRKQAQHALQESHRRKDEFLAMLAHELRNPLAPICAAAELLQLVKLDDERVRHTSRIIGRQVEHMTSLIDDLLDVSRVTRGLVELNIAPLDIGQIIADAVEQITPLLRAQRHFLHLELSPGPMTVSGDHKRLVQVMANLLGNATKYTPEGGYLCVTTTVRETQIEIAVSDNGIGMAPELQARVFDLFAQAERTPDRSSGGLGLGLALVKSLVELHGGTVACESEGLGKGSRFIVCLPRLVEFARPFLVQDSGIGAHDRNQPLRVLVVDDNEDAALTLAMLLEAAGHETFTEYGSKRALERARLVRPDVCLLDIGLPEMDGNELAQRLRAGPETAGSVLIAVTGYGQENDRQHSSAAGFDHHLVKPVDTKKLTDILARIHHA